MAASGFAGLGYQIVWTQQCTLWLGHEAAAVLAVVAAFFGGLAAGALVLGARIERSARPARWYAACEAVIALWGLLLLWLMGPASGWLLGVTGVQPHAGWQWAVAFAGSFVLLLPATAAMGATLPAMARIAARHGGRGDAIAGLYASNTAGAVAGVLAAAFWLVPAFGLVRTAGACAVLNLGCAAAVMVLSAGMPQPRGAAPAQRPGRGTGPALALLAATGLLGIGYEVLVVRVVSQVAQNTVYTFALLLAIYLIGSALGAAAYQRWLLRPHNLVRDAAALRDRLLLCLAAACLLGSASLWFAEGLRDGVGHALGPGMAAALLAESAPALAAFLLPTIAMGALFSHLSVQARAAGIGFARALGANTLGAAAAPLLFGVVLLPAFGAKVALGLVVAGYLLLALRHAWRAPAFGATAVAGLVIAATAPPLVFVDVPDGGHVVSYREGAMAAVSVVEDADGVARLRIDNRQQEGSSATRLADARQAWLPLLLHPAPQRALFLGLGTGVTASAAAEDATLQVDVAELLPEVIAASAHFAAGGVPNPRLNVVAADARRFVRAGTARYDVIVSDNFHPARSGSGALYTAEHFAAVRARLAPGGLFCQWLPLHQLDLGSLRSIVQAFLAVYPGGTALLATNSLETPVLGLVARADAGRFALARLRQRLAAAGDSGDAQHLTALGLDDDFALLGGFVAGPRALDRFAGDAPVNTDDHPVVAYRAPRLTYAPDTLPRERLLALLHELHASNAAPGELIDAGADTAWPARLAAYWAARDRFLDAGRSVHPSADVRAMLAQVREPLLAVLRISPDFRPAADPLLRMADVLGRTDAPAAEALLSELARLRPAGAAAAH